MSASWIEVPTGAPGVRAVFTTRHGGASAGPYASLNLGVHTGDDVVAVARNLAVVTAGLGLREGRLVMNRQVHGADVRHVDRPDEPPASAAADGLVTGADGLGLAVLGADCVPLLVWRADGSAVAAAHCGWRGVLAGVVRATVSRLGAGAHGAALGPGVGPCCYPVGADVRRRFRGRFGPAVVTGDAIDVREGIRIALAEAGIGPGAVVEAAHCTACEPETFFSYRRDGAATGRQAGIVWRAAGAPPLVG